MVFKFKLKALLFLPLISILQFFVGKVVNKLVLVASRCQSDLMWIFFCMQLDGPNKLI